MAIPTRSFPRKRDNPSPLIPAQAGIQNYNEKLGPRFRGDERGQYSFHGSVTTPPRSFPRKPESRAASKLGPHFRGDERGQYSFHGSETTIYRSFPRKRESRTARKLGPRFRGDERGQYLFHGSETTLHRSFPRKRESRIITKNWVPACAGTNSTSTSAPSKQPRKDRSGLW